MSETTFTWWSHSLGLENKLHSWKMHLHLLAQNFLIETLPVSEENGYPEIFSGARLLLLSFKLWP